MTLLHETQTELHFLSAFHLVAYYVLLILETKH